MHKIRRALALLIAVASLASALTNLAQIIAHPQSDEVSAWEERLQPLREAIPSEVRNAGYLDDSDIPGGGQKFDTDEFHLAQYSLAPVLLSRDPTQAWLVGNFAAATEVSPSLEKLLGKHEIQNFGFGWYLIHNLAN